MRTDRIYIAKDGKSGMHVLVRILAVGDIGADYLPIDPDGFNELMMARDARSLVLAAKGLGPMLASEGDLAGRIFVPSELQRSIAGEMDLVPSDLGGLLSECYSTSVCTESIPAPNPMRSSRAVMTLSYRSICLSSTRPHDRS